MYISAKFLLVCHICMFSSLQFTTHQNMCSMVLLIKHIFSRLEIYLAAFSRFSFIAPLINFFFIHEKLLIKFACLSCKTIVCSLNFIYAVHFTCYCESWTLSLHSFIMNWKKTSIITSLNTMDCGGKPERHWMYYLCTDFATFSKWQYIIVQKQGAEGSHQQIHSALMPLKCRAMCTRMVDVS